MKFRVFIDKYTHRINGIDKEDKFSLNMRKIFADQMAWDKTRDNDGKAVERVYNTK